MAPVLHTKPQGHLPFGSGENDFKGFLPYMGGWPSWSTDPDAANKFSFPQPTEAPCEIWL